MSFSASATRANPVETVLSVAIVEEYAAAKSRQDVAAALRVCHDDFFLDKPWPTT